MLNKNVAASEDPYAAGGIYSLNYLIEREEKTLAVRDQMA